VRGVSQTDLCALFLRFVAREWPSMCGSACLTRGCDTPQRAGAASRLRASMCDARVAVFAASVDVVMMCEVVWRAAVVWASCVDFARRSLRSCVRSRQLYVVGREAMLRMQKYSVLISGMRGVGVEVAKNIILAGLKTVAIHDDSPVQLSNLSSQFYLTQADDGAPRAAACLPHLKELNQYVNVQHVTGALTADVIKVRPGLACATRLWLRLWRAL
jgi:hypothetical protein